MYRVYFSDQVGEYPVYEPLDDTLRIFEPVLTQEMGNGGSFEFYMSSAHPYAEKVGLLKTEVIVYRDDEVIFNGRILKPEYSMENFIHLVCEGDFTYLIDSQQRPYEITGSIQDFIGKILEIHNDQVDDFKKIYPGTILVTGENSNIKRTDTKYTTTYETLKTKLLNVCEGYLRVRHDKGKKYLDYLYDYGGINEQEIRFGENLLNIDHYLDASSMVTCLIPIGGEVEYKDEKGEKQVKTIDITSENNGKDYICNEQAVEKYGKVWGSYQFKDVTEPQVLLAKAKAYLTEISALPTSMEVTALDLSLLDESIQEFKLGYWTNVISEPHGIEKKLLLVKKEINLLDPTNGSIWLGRTAKTFTGGAVKREADLSKAIEQTANNTSSEINRKIENATNLITGGLGGYVVLDNIDPNTGKQMHPWRILIMNTPDKETAKNVIQINQNGIGFSTTGINGPYRNAWTIDGNLIADFITAGTMLADRIRGGTMELGGVGIGKNGAIVVKDINGREIVKINIDGIEVKKGKITGSHIIAGNGMFEADADTVYIGSFYTFETRYGRYLATQDQSTGMGDNDLYNFWTGWDGTQNVSSQDPRRVLQHYGCVLSPRNAYAQEMYLNNSIFQGNTHYWGVGESIDDIYSRLEALERR